MEELSKLDIRNTHPKVQHDFCSLWNEIVQEARNRGSHTFSVFILKRIRHLYHDLHQGTDAALPVFSASNPEYRNVLLHQPSWYPFCNIAGHQPHSTPHVSRPLPTHPDNSPDDLSPAPTSGNTASHQTIQVPVNIVVEPPSSYNPMTTSEGGASSHSPDITPQINPAYSGSHPTSESPTALVTTAPPDITSTVKLYHSPEDSDVVASSAEPRTSQILSTASMHALVPIPTSLPNTRSEFYQASVTSISNPWHFSSGSSISASHPTGSATLPPLHPRGLVNTKNMCFANAVLQLLVNSPPFWNLFRELDDPKGRRPGGFPETGGGVTPLVDATVRFFNEFTVGESPPTKQQSQLTLSRTSGADEEDKDDNIVDSFEPTYLYDAMKETTQLRPLLVRPCARIVASFY